MIFEQFEIGTFTTKTTKVAVQFFDPPKKMPPILCINVPIRYATYMQTAGHKIWAGCILQQEVNMDRIEMEVDRLYKQLTGKRGALCEFPVIGGSFIKGVDRVVRQKRLSCLALSAREWFAIHGPADAPPLPVSYNEREDLKGGHGLLAYIVALYARSLEGRKYDLKEHPSFPAYVRGVLWETECLGIGLLPNYPDELVEVMKRFPPRALAGMGRGLCWQPSATSSSRPRKAHAVSKSRRAH
jgi:hypothetical protein